jgi:predicted DsbA family dithiol-disulfide isomerase
VLGRIGASARLDPSGLGEALRTARYRSLVFEEFLEAANQGIHGIPTILIPGQAPIVGAVPYAELRRAVERALGAASAGSWKESSSDGPIIQEGTAFF